MQELIPLTDERLRRHQLSQEYVLVDLQKTDADDLAQDNLMTALARIEQIQSVTDLLHVVSSLDRLLDRAGNTELRDTFQVWIKQLAGTLFSDQPLPPSATLGELKMTLEERIAEWPKPYIAQGIAQGRTEGRAEGRTEGHINSLCQLAAAKFGAAAKTPTAEALASLTDEHTLDAAGRHLLAATSLDDFLARLRLISSRPAEP